MAQVLSWEEISTFFPYQCCIYSTHKHTPENPRLRLIIPLFRDVGEEEYAAVSRMVAKEIGIDLFDDTTYEPERLMYWPSTSRNGIFVYEEKDGSLLDPDVFLNKYDDWRDTSTWPVSSRQSEVLDRSLKEQADPLSKGRCHRYFLPYLLSKQCNRYVLKGYIRAFSNDWSL